jgi:hypothetical protein
MDKVVMNNTPEGDLIQPVANPPRETCEGSSALRMRRLRERRRAGGTRVFPVEVGAQAMEFLIQQGLLFRENSEDSLAVGTALQEALTEWAQTK